ncbi:reverse transcriptase domain-containing protein [Tanacetum coccineum]
MPVTRQGTNDAMTLESIQAMIDRAIQRNSTHTQDDASQNSGGGLRRPVQPARVCSYTDFMKCIPLNFKGTEGVVGLSQWLKNMESVFHIIGCAIDNEVKFATSTLLGAALTWWNGHVRTLGHDVAYVMTWGTLKKKLTDKYCPKGEIKKLEIELWNLRVRGNDVAAYTQLKVTVHQIAFDLLSDERGDDYLRIWIIRIKRFQRASDEEPEGPMKDQPLSADASPTALSPSYIANFNPEEDEEDPEEDPVDYPANEGDNSDDESSDDDNDDDDVEKDEEDEEEEEHLAPADPSAVPTDDPFAAALPSSSPPPENVESLKDNIREIMTTIDQGMRVEEIERVVAQNYKKMGHMTWDCRNPAAARNQRTHACYKYGSLRHFKSEYPIVKFQKRVDKKIRTLTERHQAENKRKLNNTPKNNQNQQQRYTCSHETMTTVDQGMSVEEIERVIAERVANAIEAIAIYETKTNMARKPISQTEQQEYKVAENANNKRKLTSLT